MDSKSLFASRTFWVNIIAMIGYLLAKAGLGGGVVDPQAAAFIDAVYPVLLGLVNVYLRTRTKQPVTFR